MQKNKQELEILRHKVEHFQASGGGSGDSYTKAQTNALLSEKADKSTTYTKTETNTAISSAIGDIFAGDPIELVVDEETGNDCFPTDKLDILRLHKPFVYEEQVWYCCYDETGYGWIYFTVNIDNNPVMVSEVHYMLILDETKQVSFDDGDAILISEDLTAATITGGTIDNDATAIANCYLDKMVTELNIAFTATSDISADAAIIGFSGKRLPWKPNQILTGIKSDGSLIALKYQVDNHNHLSKIITPQAIRTGEVLDICAISTVNKKRSIFGNP